MPVAKETAQLVDMKINGVTTERQINQQTDVSKDTDNNLLQMIIICEKKQNRVSSGRINEDIVNL